MALSTILERAAAVGQAILAGPRALVGWVRANPSRALAIVWMAGMAVFLWIGFRRGWKQHQLDVAKADAEEARKEKKKRVGGPEVVEMMDVDEMEQIEKDRMHSYGLTAAGDTAEVDAETMKKAQEARRTVAVAEGEKVGGDGDVVVVSRGGLAGWVKRNKGKKADPETLAWLRSEEAKEGGKAYAEWADGGNSLDDWIKRGKKRKTGETGNNRRQETGNRKQETGSETGELGIAKVPPAHVEKKKAELVERFDAEAIGRAELEAIAPEKAVKAVVVAEPTQIDADTLQGRMEASSVLKPVKVELKDKRLVMKISGDGMFDGDELSAHGKEVARQLVGVIDERVQLLVVADDPAKGMEMVGMMAVAGLDPERVSIVTRKEAAETIDIVEVR